MSIQATEINSLNEAGITRADIKPARYVIETGAKTTADKIVFRRMAEADRVFGYETMSLIDDISIRKMLKKVSLTDVIVALVDADGETKTAVYRNLAIRTADYVSTMVNRLETGNTRGIMIERGRNMISEAFIEMLRE